MITHAFRGASGVLDADGKVTAEFKDAVDRGVRLDVGHSGTDFRFATARRLFDQGYLPTTISTDLNVFNVDHPVGSLARTMSKIWALGVPLADVVEMATLVTGDGHPPSGRARHAGAGSRRRRLGPAHRRRRTVRRSPTASRRSRRSGVLVPVGCLRAGEWIAADPG